MYVGNLEILDSYESICTSTIQDMIDVTSFLTKPEELLG
jgi:hypothetical protein